MDTPPHESEHKSTNTQKKDKNVLLLLTKRRERRKLDAEIEELEFDLLLYGDKDEASN